MSSKILTSCVAGIDTFMHDPHGVLSDSEEGAVAIFVDNAPAFYAISAQRLAQLLELETRLARQARNTVALNNQLHEEPVNSIAVPMGKFTMYPGWQPDADFQRMAALWGIPVTQPVTSEELAAFIAYWQAEGKLFHHVQWQQKLARSIQIGRSSNSWPAKSNINTISATDNQIPPGFRG